MNPEVEKLIILLDEARRSFFHEVGDSANAVILDASTYGAILGASGALQIDDKGRQLLSGLEVIFTSSPGRKVMIAKVVDPLDECESCRGL